MLMKLILHSLLNQKRLMGMTDTFSMANFILYAIIRYYLVICPDRRLNAHHLTAYLNGIFRKYGSFHGNREVDPSTAYIASNFTKKGLKELLSRAHVVEERIQSQRV